MTTTKAYLQSARIQAKGRKQRIEAVELRQNMTLALRHHWDRRHGEGQSSKSQSAIIGKPEMIF
jgi:hypothetical protein